MPLNSLWSPYADADTYRERCDALRMFDYRPTSIHARCDPGGQPEFSSVWWRPQMQPAARAELGRQYARLAVALQKQGNSTWLRSGLDNHQADVRGAVIDACAQFRVEPGWLVNLLLDSKSIAGTRRAVTQALCLIPPDSVALEVKRQLKDAWPRLFAAVNDSGLRSALELLESRWQLHRATSELSFVSSQEIKTIGGQRMVVLDPPLNFLMGSEPGEPGRNGHDERRTTFVCRASSR